MSRKIVLRAAFANLAREHSDALFVTVQREGTTILPGLGLYNQGQNGQAQN
jgi:hypothetical protein